jgi:PKHD-type hydroxylase
MRQAWQFWRQGVSQEFIDLVQQEADKLDWVKATTFGQKGEDQGLSSTRRSNVKWLNGQAEISSTLWGFIQAANQQLDVDVVNRADVQFTQYDSDDEGFYGQHHDVNWENPEPHDRKISISILLSDPADFDGGNLSFHEVTNKGIEWQKGSVLCFPSFIQHSVSPVTRGTRKSLVAWFSGPRWR